MYFTGKDFRNILKQKHDIIVTTEKFIVTRLKKEGYKCLLLKTKWKSNALLG